MKNKAKLLLLLPFVIFGLPSNKQQNNNLGKELKQFEGAYSIVENEIYYIDPENLPHKITDLFQTKIEQVSLKYLTKIKYGYLCTYNVRLSQKNYLLITTINKEYQTVDFRKYYNGKNIFDHHDKISLVTYFANEIHICQTHPNEFEEPNCESNSIEKFILRFSDLQFQKQPVKQL